MDLKSTQDILLKYIKTQSPFTDLYIYTGIHLKALKSSLYKEAKTLGRTGERIARKYLERKGHKILNQNWKCPYGEIDIISFKDSFIYFTEVKTRTYTEIEEFTARSALTSKKIKQIQRLINEYRYSNSRKLKRIGLKRYKLRGIAITADKRYLLKQFDLEYIRIFDEK